MFLIPYGRSDLAAKYYDKILFKNLGGCLTQAHPADCGFDTYIHALQTLSLGGT